MHYRPGSAVGGDVGPHGDAVARLTMMDSWLYDAGTRVVFDNRNLLQAVVATIVTGLVE